MESGFPSKEKSGKFPQSKKTHGRKFRLLSINGKRKRVKGGLSPEATGERVEEKG